MSRIVFLAGVVTAGLALASPAQAQNLIANGTLPDVEFIDTSPGANDRAALMFANKFSDPATPELFSFVVRGRTDSVDAININTDTRGDQSIVIDLLGDVYLADSTVFIDRSSTQVGIGTVTPLAELQINALSPELLLDAPFANGAVRYDDNELTIAGFGSNDIVRMADDASNDSLYIDADGRIGLGTASPEASLHLRNAHGFGRIHVQDSSLFTTANRTLLQLTNNGRPQVRLSNSASGVNWVTGMGTDDAYIIRRGSNEYRFTKGGRVRWFLSGIPDPIFDFSNNGNLTLAGTQKEQSDVNAKRDVVPVDGPALLARVAVLPVSTWTYRHDESGARHVGPMAQDFHAAFGLGADDRHVSPRDVAGVALAAVKELQAVARRRDADYDRLLREKDARIAALTARLAALEARLAR